MCSRFPTEDRSSEIEVKTRITLRAAVIAACGVVIVVPQQGGAQQRAAGPYAAEQAGAGRAAYQANCASCEARIRSKTIFGEIIGPRLLCLWLPELGWVRTKFSRPTARAAWGAAIQGRRRTKLRSHAVKTSVVRASGF